MLLTRVTLAVVSCAVSCGIVPCRLATSRDDVGSYRRPALAHRKKVHETIYFFRPGERVWQKELFVASLLASGPACGSLRGSSVVVYVGVDGVELALSGGAARGVWRTRLHDFMSDRARS